MTDHSAPQEFTPTHRRFVYKAQYARPEARRISDGVIMRIDDVYEVDPALMGVHFDQQKMPLWDVERIVEMRNEHLDWMHDHFSYETLVAGEEDELYKGPGTPPDPPPWDFPSRPAKGPRPILPW